MIIKTFSKHVVAIPRDTDIPYIPEHTPGKKGLKIYEIPATSVVLVEERKYKKTKEEYEAVIKIYCGHSIYPFQIGAMIDYLTALSVEFKPTLEIAECDNLKFLNKLDKFVQIYNHNL